MARRKLPPSHTKSIARTIPWNGGPLIAGGGGGTVLDAAPRIGASLIDLNAAGTPGDGQVGLVRIGEHEEEFVFNATLGKWVGKEYASLTTTDSWALDFSRAPLAAFRNAWCKFSGGVGWEVRGPQTKLRSAVTLPAATINIADPVNGSLDTAGQVLIRDQLVTYTGVSGASGAMQLTGCSGGSGTFPADSTPVIPFASTQGGGDPGGWGTTVTPLDHVGELWAAGFRLQERANAWINGSVDLVSMSVAPFYLNYNLGEDMGAAAAYPSANNAPVAGMLGPGLTLTGPAYDMGGFSAPGNHDRRSERGFEMRSAEWTNWAASAPTKRFLVPVLYGKMNSAAANDNGEVYGWTHRLRWVSQ